MRGLCAALVIADLTWASLKTLHEHTIINHLQPNRRTKTKMDSIPVKKPLHPATRPRETSRRGSGAGPACASKDQQRTPMQDESASAASLSSTGAVMRRS
jgi:hypothetical protein